MVFFSIMGLIFKKIEIPEKRKNQILFVLIIMITAVLLSQAASLKMEKKILLGVLIVSSGLALKFYSHRKKIPILILIMSVIPAGKCFIKLVESGIQKEWTVLPDAIAEVELKSKPNIYIIQPDGYAGPEVMNKPPYNFENSFYSWLEGEGFKLYPNYRSNYPASMSSNSALFSMRQHKFGKTVSASIEMPKAREAIVGNNNAVEILKKNGYATFFVVEDEYFQQNLTTPGYDYYNIPFSEIPYFSNGNMIKKDVFEDLKTAMDFSVDENPRFYFVEKLLPHHIHFAASQEEERDTYIQKIREVNEWLKTTLNYITEKDPEAVVIVLADHGGWVGLSSYKEMFSTTNPAQIQSVYSSLAAIRWNGHLIDDMDSGLKSSVNFFRVLFSNLSGNKELLKHTEDNSSYRLKQGVILNSVEAIIDNDGQIIKK